VPDSELLDTTMGQMPIARTVQVLVFLEIVFCLSRDRV
jgi:hypothetical protein